MYTLLVLSKFETTQVTCFTSPAQQGRSRQSGWSGFGRTTISQGKKQNSILQKASNKQKY